MATALKNLSEYTIDTQFDFSSSKIGIVVAEWNHEITNALFEGAKQICLHHGIKPENLAVSTVPGTFELPLAAQWLFENPALACDAVICLGCVIQGETRHFDFICDATSNAISQLALKCSKPVIFGVLTTDNLEQAQDRAGGKHGNKGIEAGVTALKMLIQQENSYKL